MEKNKFPSINCIYWQNSNQYNQHLPSFNGLSSQFDPNWCQWNPNKFSSSMPFDCHQLFYSPNALREIHGNNWEFLNARKELNNSSKEPKAEIPQLMNGNFEHQNPTQNPNFSILCPNQKHEWISSGEFGKMTVPFSLRAEILQRFYPLQNSFEYPNLAQSQSFSNKLEPENEKLYQPYCSKNLQPNQRRSFNIWKRMTNNPNTTESENNFDNLILIQLKSWNNLNFNKLDTCYCAK